MDKEEKRFRDLWQSLDNIGKFELARDLSRKCNVTPRTVYAWGQGYRTPSPVNGLAAMKYLRSKFRESIKF